jgi:hypothetical protein
VSIKSPMNTGIKDGKLVIDMEEANELWNDMSKDQQYEMMCILFEPMMEKATKMQRALHKVLEAAEADKSYLCYELALAGLITITSKG